MLIDFEFLQSDSLDKDVGAKMLVTTSMISVIGSLSVGQLFDKNSELVKKIIEQNAMFAGIIGRVLLADLFPITRPLLLRKSWQQFCDFARNFTDYILGKIAEHKRLESTGEIRDFQDAFEKVYFESKPEQMQRLSITKDAIQGAGQDLFGAGFATISEHIFYALKLLGSRPDLQADLRQAVESVCPKKEDRVTLEHRSKMPYAEAFMEELLRYFSHTPFSLPHGTIEVGTGMSK